MLHRDGMLIILCVIHVINKEIKDSHARFVKELIEQLHTGKWLNVACAISKNFIDFIPKTFIISFTSYALI